MLRFFSAFSSFSSSSAPKRVTKSERREVRATLVLTTFMLSQCVLPQAMLLQSGVLPVARAAQEQPVKSKPSSKGKSEKITAKAGSEKPGSAKPVAVKTPKPPLWYVQSRRKEANRVEATRKGMKMLLAQNTTTRPRGLTPPTVTNVGGAQARAEAVGGPALLNAEFPGHVRRSAPLGTMPYISVLKLDLSNDRVPTQAEIVAQGGLAGPLSPVAPAEPKQVEEVVNAELREQGFGQGIETKIPTVAQVQGVPTLVARVRYFEAAKKKVKEARAQNREFALAMAKWKVSRFAEADTDFRTYLEKFPNSPWAPEATIHIGNYAKYTGRGNEAEAAYQKVIAETSGDTSEMSYNAHRKAFGRLTDLYLIQGRYNEARPMLEDFVNNDTNWRRRTWGMYWLTKIQSSSQNPNIQLASLDCGTEALAAMLTVLNKPQQARQVLKIKPTTTQGFSLAELRTIASRQGVSLTGFAGTPAQLAGLPLPALLHYNSKTQQTKAGKHTGVTPYGHYVLVRSYDAKRGLWSISNPQERMNSTLNFSQLAREWSGRGLMLDRPASQLASNAAAQKKAVVRLSMHQMRTTFGTGYDVMGTTGDIGCCEENESVRGNCGSPDGCGCQGEPGVSVNRVNQNVFITDTPLWYTPAKGPRVDITISYNSLDATNYNMMVGNKWSFNYGSYLAETADKVIVYRPDGGQDNMASSVSSGTTTYTAPRGVYSTMTKTAPDTFIITDQNDDKSFYGIPSNFPSTTVPVLLEKRDRWNQSLTFQYGMVAGKVVPFTITDADGKITRLQYDSQAHLIYAQTPDERQASFSYDVNGNLIQCIDAAGQAFQYAYDALVNITQLNTAQGPWTFNYEKSLYYIDQETGEPRYNEHKTIIYDPTQDKPQVFGFTTAYPNHKPGLYYTLDHRGNKTEYRVTPISSGSSSVGLNLPPNYYISSVTPPQSTFMSTTSYTYDTTSVSLLKKPISINSGGVVTNLTYNGQGNPTQIVQRMWSGAFPVRTTNLTYASNGHDVTGVTVTGQLSFSATPVTQTLLQSATYDAQHKPTQIIDAVGQTTNFTYTSWGAPQTVTKYEDGISRIMTYTYGASGNDLNRLVSIQLNGAIARTFTYDNSGRIKAEADSRGLTTSYRYNNLDKPIGTYYPDGTNELIDYTCCSLPGMITDRSGRRSYFDYDSLKRLVRTQNADGQALQFTYDSDSNRTGMMDAKGVWTRWEYDALGRVVTKRYGDGRPLNTHYNSIGAVDYTINASGTTNYAYDWVGELTSIDYPSTMGPIKDVTMAYDALGRPQTMTDAVGNTNWTYDTYGRLQGEDGPWANDSQSYSYDSLNRPNGLSIGRDAGSNDAFTYSYDGLGRMSSLAATLGGWGSLDTLGTNNTTYNYVGNSTALDYVSLPNSTRRVYGYESGGLQRFNSIQNITGANTNLSSSSYNYGNTSAPSGYRDNRVSHTRKYGNESAQTVSYGYNSSSMLTGEGGAAGGVSTPSFARNYSFDAMGNRSQWSDAIAHTRTDATYNRLNQLIGISNYDTTTTPTLTGTSTYSYDNDGNMTEAASYNAGGTAIGGSTYTYDDASRLTSITTPNTSKWVFVYDGFSRLRKSQQFNWSGNSWVLQQEKWRVYRGMDVIQERDNTNVVTASVIRDSNGILARVTGSSSADRAFYGYDGSGNVTTLTDGSANVVASYTYDAFGNTLTSSGSVASSNPYRFSSKEQIAGLYYYGYRFYSASLGRWINRDPIQENGGVNLYEFVSNNPANLIDPHGLSVKIFDWWEFDESTWQAAKVGFWSGLDGLNPFNDYFKDHGYYKPCDPSARTGYFWGWAGIALISAILIGRAAPIIWRWLGPPGRKAVGAGILQGIGGGIGSAINAGRWPTFGNLIGGGIGGGIANAIGGPSNPYFAFPGGIVGGLFGSRIEDLLDFSDGMPWEPGKCS